MKTAISSLILIYSLSAFAEDAAQNSSSKRVDQRQANQEQRIDQGVQNGQLTEQESAALNHRQDKIDRAETSMKSDGKFTSKEKRKLERMQDRANRQIHRKKHNARHR